MTAVARRLQAVRSLVADVESVAARAARLLDVIGGVEIGATRLAAYRTGFTRGYVAGYDAGVRDCCCAMMHGRAA